MQEPSATVRRYDIGPESLSAIVRADEQVSARTLTDILRGNFSPEVTKGHFETLKTFGVGRDVPPRDWQDYLMQMLQNGLFEIAYEEGNHLKLTESGRQVLYKGRKVELAVIRREEKPQKRGRKSLRPVAAPVLFTGGRPAARRWRQAVRNCSRLCGLYANVWPMHRVFRLISLCPTRCCRIFVRLVRKRWKHSVRSAASVNSKKKSTGKTFVEVIRRFK